MGKKGKDQLNAYIHDLAPVLQGAAAVMGTQRVPCGERSQPQLCPASQRVSEIQELTISGVCSAKQCGSRGWGLEPAVLSQDALSRMDRGAETAAVAGGQSAMHGYSDSSPWLASD